MDKYLLWDFLTERGRNILVEWAKADRLTVRDKAMLNNKIRRLAQMDYDLAIGTKLLAGPIYKHVYKLVIHGDVMLRPMLCRGPIDNESEYTFLFGAVETGGKLPAGAKEKAEEYREVVIKDAKRRCRHESV
ncbi:MAG TPA: hypothetical protein VFD58_06230 [Blastocatellia bacterium]|nr:hypothetical protein [Blastocatellia bacterium]